MCASTKGVRNSCVCHYKNYLSLWAQTADPYPVRDTLDAYSLMLIQPYDHIFYGFHADVFYVHDVLDLPDEYPVPLLYGVLDDVSRHLHTIPTKLLAVPTKLLLKSK